MTIAPAPGRRPGRWPEVETDGVGAIVRYLELDEAEYDEIVDLAEQLLADPDFKRLQGLIARALALAPVLDGESVAILREAAGVPEPRRAEEVDRAAAQTG